MDVTHVTRGGVIFRIDNVTQVDTRSEGLDDGIPAVTEFFCIYREQMSFPFSLPF